MQTVFDPIGVLTERFCKETPAMPSAASGRGGERVLLPWLLRAFCPEAAPYRLTFRVIVPLIALLASCAPTSMVS